MLPLLLTLCTLAPGCKTPPKHARALPVKPPAAVGMSADRLAAIDHVAARAIAAEGFPGAAIVVGRQGALAWARGYGTTDWSARGAPVSADRTLYDLASLTKVVATTTAIMLLYDQGKIRLDAPVRRYLPEFTGEEKSRVTIRELLEHRSGLPAGRELWREAHGRARARRLVLTTALEYEPGTRQVYSDLGMDVLGFVVERVSGERLDTYVRRHVFQKLGMRSTTFRPDEALRLRAAPTAISPRRHRRLRGEVHDEDAAVLGGVAGHAGLFSTASDLAIFAQMMLGGGTVNGIRLVRDSTVALFTRRSAGTRALGWDTCAGGASCGQRMSTRAFGHTGFTGTSLWIDPDRDMFVIVLTNAVHECRDGSYPRNAIVQDVRADVADIATLAVDAAADAPAEWRADRAIGWTRR